MLQTKIKQLNEMETAILHLVQHQEKVNYDKEHLQTECAIKSKIWVTRSVNRLIQLGFLKESTSTTSDTSTLTLTPPATQLPLISPNAKHSTLIQPPISLTMEQEQLLSHLYHLTEEGTESTTYCLKEIAESLNVEKNIVKKDIKNLKTLQLIEPSQQNSRVQFTPLGRGYLKQDSSSPNNLSLLPRIIHQPTNPIDLNDETVHLTRVERRLLAILTLTFADYPLVHLQALKEVAGTPEVTLHQQLIRLANQQLIRIYYPEQWIELTVHPLPKLGTYETSMSSRAIGLKKRMKKLTPTTPLVSTPLSSQQQTFLTHCESLSDSEFNILIHLIHLQLQQPNKPVDMNHLVLQTNSNYKIIKAYILKLEKTSLVKLEVSTQKVVFLIDIPEIQFLQNILPPLPFIAPNKDTEAKKEETTTLNNSVSLKKEETTEKTEISLIPASDYLSRLFIIDTENIWIPITESLNSILTENDKLLLMFSSANMNRSLSAHMLHLILNAKWKTETFEIPIFQTKSNSLDHALIAELSFQINQHPSHQFFILSKDKGFLSAIHHLKVRFNLKDDQIQLLPHFFQKEELIKALD